MNKKKRIVIALGGNALGNTLPEQMTAVKITAKAIVDLIEEGCEVVVAHGNGPQVGMINNAMSALSREDPNQPNTPLSVCVAMSQAYIGYDLQNALREELLNRNITDIPVTTMITQIRVDAEDPAFNAPSKPIGHFMTEEQAKIAEEKYGYIMKEDAGRGYRRVVASPKPAEIIEIGAIRSLVDSGQLVIACGGGGSSPLWRQMLADVYGCPVKTVVSKEGPALGAAILAGVGAGLYPNVQEACRGMIQTNPAQQPDAQASEQYERFYQVYQSLYPALRESFQRLSKL